MDSRGEEAKIGYSSVAIECSVLPGKACDVAVRVDRGPRQIAGERNDHTVTVDSVTQEHLTAVVNPDGGSKPVRGGSKIDQCPDLSVCRPPKRQADKPTNGRNHSERSARHVTSLFRHRPCVVSNSSPGNRSKSISLQKTAL